MDGVLPASTQLSVSPRLMSLSPNALGSLQNQSLLEMWGHIPIYREHVGSSDTLASPLTCQLALIQVFHRIGLAKAGNADVHPWGIGHFPRGSVVHHPVGTGTKVAEELCPHGEHGAGVEITG